jgi:hypothetical protein
MFDATTWRTQIGAPLQRDLFQYLYQFMSAPRSTPHKLDGSALQTSGPCSP